MPGRLPIYFGNRLKWTEPLQRKSVVYVIDKPLVPASWPEAASHEENNAAAAEVMMAVRESVGNIFDEPPVEPSLVEGVVNAMRGLFGN